MKLKGKSKIFSILVKSFTLISIFAIGFSSFNVADNAPIKGNLSINIGKVLNANDYINNFSISNFEYNKSGIINDDVVTAKGTLSLSFNLNLIDENNNYFFDSYNLDFIDLNVKITESTNGTSEQSFSLLNYLNKTNPIMCRLRINNESTTTSVQVNNFSNELGELTFNYEYHNNDFSKIDFIFFNFLIDFDFTEAIATFETSIYNNLKSSNFSLNYFISF